MATRLSSQYLGFRRGRAAGQKLPWVVNATATVLGFGVRVKVAGDVERVTPTDELGTFEDTRRLRRTAPALSCH